MKQTTKTVTEETANEIKTKKVEVVVEGVRFSGDFNTGAWRKGKFYPQQIWASMAPVVTKELRAEIEAAVKSSIERDYSIGDISVDKFMQKFVDDAKTDEGKTFTRFHAGCKRCESKDLMSHPDWMVEAFRKALRVQKDASFDMTASTTISLGQKWTSEWKLVGPEVVVREFEGEQFCVFHGVSTYHDVEVID
jgi:hypothetical protein